MEKQFNYFYRRLESIPEKNIRPLIRFLDEPNRLVGIKGARGVGKTTLLLQYAKKRLPVDHRTLYVSLDDPWFLQNSLEDLTDDFAKHGGATLLLDEVHRYPRWSESLKFIYDQYADLRIIFTGSSVLHIDASSADLSRRAIFRTLHGLSFREYLNWHYELMIESSSLDYLLANHEQLSRQITSLVKPIKAFQDYLLKGYYPFHNENPEVYSEKLRETSRIAIESDLRVHYNLGPEMTLYLLKLLSILADTVPFTPNVSKLSERVGTTRNTLIELLRYLEKAQLIHRLFRQAEGITRLQKPDKLYLDNPNLMFAHSWSDVDKGALRETFFVNQVRPVYPVQVARQGDFIVDRKITIETGGKTKTGKQLKGLDNAFIAADGIEYGFGNKVPLWMFGLLY